MRRGTGFMGARARPADRSQAAPLSAPTVQTIVATATSSETLVPVTATFEVKRLLLRQSWRACSPRGHAAERRESRAARKLCARQTRQSRSSNRSTVLAPAQIPTANPLPKRAEESERQDLNLRPLSLSRHVQPANVVNC
jgi:hypothetical protein